MSTVQDIITEEIKQVELAQKEFIRFTEFSKKVEGTNIYPNTLLCTDYLNHFNEIIMLIEMIPDMPDILEECKEWKPKTYKQHFKEVVFSDSALAIEAYEAVPACFKEPFENTIAQMDYLVLKALDHCENDIANGQMDKLSHHVEVTLSALKQFIEIASSIIHGTGKATEHLQVAEQVEAVLPPSQTEEEMVMEGQAQPESVSDADAASSSPTAGEVLDQSQIDELFP